MISLLWEGLPALLLFGPLFWIIIYLQTYRHFPRMARRKRILYAIEAATVMTAVLLLVGFIALFFIVRSLMA